MERELSEIGKLIVDDGSKLLDEFERKQREIQLDFEKKRLRLFRWAWVVMITLTTLISIGTWIILR